MMVIIWRNARLEKRKAAAPRKLHGAVEVETGWQVFPLPAPPTLMSSVGTRRSTRVLIPKISSVARVGDGVSSVLGSPKTLSVRRHGDKWLGVFGGGGAEDHRCEKREKGETRDLGCSDGLNEPGETAGKTPESDVPEDSCDTCLGRKFGIVYGRRRQRHLSGGGASTSSSVGHRASEIKRRYGLVFVRKGCRRKSDVPTLHQEIKREPELAETSIERGIIKRELKIAVSAGNFAKKNGIMENSLCTNINDRMVLTLFVESSCASSSLCFPRFLITTLKWMRRSTVTVQEFAAFLLSGSLATVFSRQGVHVLPLRWQKNNVVFSGVPHCCGLCKIYGARQSVPLLLLDFSALPIYFRSLHVSMLLGSLYLPRVLTRYLMCLSGAVNYEENDSCVLVEAGNLGTELSMVPVTVRHEQNDTIDACKSAIENATNLLGSGLSKHCGRRSFSGGWSLSGAVNYEENDSCVLVEGGNLGTELSMVPVTVRHEQNDTIDAFKSAIENATNLLGSRLSKRCGRRSFSGGWSLSGAVNYEENDPCVLVEAGNLGTELSMVPVTVRHEQNDTIDACKSAIENATNFLGSGLSKRCGRRSFSGGWNLSGAVNYEENDSCVLVEAGNLGTELSMVPVTMRHEQNDTIDACKSSIENATNLLGSGLSKHCGRRSFSGSWSLLSSNADALLPLHSNQCSASGLSEAKASFHAEFMAKPICPEVPDACTEKVLSSKYESDVSTLFSSHRKQRKSANKELKSALAEVKKNIDTSRCNANVLVVDADRCWREEGFEVLLDTLPSKEWRIAIKSQGETKYLHKPLNMRRCVVNRFTHTYIWAAEDRWKLEFLDRWDWLVFKELHEECQQRNLQEDSSRTISVPVYREVSGYADGSRSTFIRPDYYIRTEDDEIRRGLSSKIARYDMDSGDEKWLTDHNSGILHPGLGELKNISADDFEKIIYAMEKGAYSNVDHVFDKEKAFKFCQDLGKREILGAIYDYWEKKRNKKHTALVREFQSPPLLRSLLVHEPFLRKKRSFKR